MAEVDGRQATERRSQQHKRGTPAQRLPEHERQEGHAVVRREPVERDRQREGDAEHEQHPDQEQARAG